MLLARADEFIACKSQKKSELPMAAGSLTRGTIIIAATVSDTFFFFSLLFPPLFHLDSNQKFRTLFSSQRDLNFTVFFFQSATVTNRKCTNRN